MYVGLEQWIEGDLIWTDLIRYYKNSRQLQDEPVELPNG